MTTKELKPCSKKIGGIQRKNFILFVINIPICLVEKKCMKKMHYFSIPKRLCILKKGRTQEWETWEYVWRKSKGGLFSGFVLFGDFLGSSGIMAEKSLLILCFIFKLYLMKICFFGKNILLLWADPKCCVFAFFITLVATATPANNTFICIRKNMGTKAGIDFVPDCQ